MGGRPQIASKSGIRWSLVILEVSISNTNRSYTKLYVFYCLSCFSVFSSQAQICPGDFSTPQRLLQYTAWDDGAEEAVDGCSVSLASMPHCYSDTVQTSQTHVLPEQSGRRPNRSWSKGLGILNAVTHRPPPWAMARIITRSMIAWTTFT
jgi:hypothetical protein